MRISERQRYQMTARRMSEARDKNAQSLNTLSTQKRINKISDDPIGSARVLEYRNRINRVEQYEKNLLFSRGFLERSESAIQGISENLRRAKELGIGMANSTYDDASRDATSREVKEIIKNVVSNANTQYNGRYVFSGFRTKTPTLGEDGEYLGDDGAIFLQTSPGNFRQINLQARGLFQASPEEKQANHFNMIDSLELLHSGMKENDRSMIHQALTELDYQMSKTTSYQSSIGAIWNGLEQTGSKLELDKEITTEELSKEEDADIYNATSEFKRTETVLQSTLLASNKLLQPSLMNFLQ